ncbi:hypothetical protein CANCADRAFT_130663 [Tortispora caseinolytica NRRL Y-17796]|uniref:Uncharacterized protein n=1 Tax=Tortispora caseinolytica NRRL Y-17796 TaxID=767744 RepID=A0A1E4TAV6_9ASCO|nr:hypothetical protein CANCADRAFT_130663 [Tortispora caseinolytica NRRL Y-17796]
MNQVQRSPPPKKPRIINVNNSIPVKSEYKSERRALLNAAALPATASSVSKFASKLAESSKQRTAFKELKKQINTLQGSRKLHLKNLKSNSSVLDFEDEPLYAYSSDIRIDRKYGLYDSAQKEVNDMQELSVSEVFAKITPPHFSDSELIDWYLIGIVANKSNVRETRSYSENRPPSKFITLTITDLRTDIAVNLFDKAFEANWKVRQGSVVLILNPKVIPMNNKFILSVANDAMDLIEIAHSSDIATCTVINKDGHSCSNWVDVRKSTKCEYHANQSLVATSSRRQEINARAGVSSVGPQTTWSNIRRRATHVSSSREPFKVKQDQSFENAGGKVYYTDVGGAGVQPIHGGAALAMEPNFIDLTEKEESEKRQKEARLREQEALKKLVKRQSNGAQMLKAFEEQQELEQELEEDQEDVELHQGILKNVKKYSKNQFSAKHHLIQKMNSSKKTNNDFIRNLVEDINKENSVHRKEYAKMRDEHIDRRLELLRSAKKRRRKTPKPSVDDDLEIVF